MLLKQALLLFYTTILVSAKVYDRCQLAHELKYIYKFPGHEIPTWMCIVAHESIYDTAAMNPGSGDHGLFQISQLYWCSPPGDGFGCNAPCANFRDDNIDDDVQCVKRIFKEHSRISGDGFNAWAVYPIYCKEDNTRYINGCFATDNDIGTEDVPSQPVSTEEPLDEDDDGYDFPPLPSPPRKILDNVISGDNEFYEFSPLSSTSEISSIVVSNYQDFRSFIATTATSLVTRSMPLTSLSIFTNTGLNPTIEPIVKIQSTQPAGIKQATIQKSVIKTTEDMTKEINNITSVLFSRKNKQFTTLGSMYYPSHITPRTKQITIKPFSQNFETNFTSRSAFGLVNSSNIKPPKILSNKLFKNKSTTTTRPFDNNQQLLNLPNPTLRPPFKVTTSEPPSSEKQSITTLFYKSTPPTTSKLLHQKPNIIKVGDEPFSITTRATKSQTSTKKTVDQGTVPITFKPLGFQKYTTEKISEKTTLSTTTPAHPKLFVKSDNSKNIKLVSTDSSEEVITTTLKPLSNNRNTLEREDSKHDIDFPGAPVLLSFPHLLYADQEYISSVVGLKPDKAKHETLLTLEPISGFPLQLAQRVQFNMFIRPIEGVDSMDNVSKALIPVLWLEESTILGDEYINMLKTTLFRSLKIFNIIKWVVIVIGLALIMLSFFLFVYMKAP